MTNCNHTIVCSYSCFCVVIIHCPLLCCILNGACHYASWHAIMLTFGLVRNTRRGGAVGLKYTNPDTVLSNPTLYANPNVPTLVLQLSCAHFLAFECKLWQIMQLVCDVALISSVLTKTCCTTIKLISMASVNIVINRYFCINKVITKSFIRYRGIKNAPICFMWYDIVRDVVCHLKTFFFACWQTLQVWGFL